MLRMQIAAAIGCARASALDEIMREVWTRYSAGQLTEEDAGQLSTLAHERREAWRGSGQAGLGLVMPPAERCPTPVRGQNKSCSKSYAKAERIMNIMLLAGLGLASEAIGSLRASGAQYPRCRCRSG